MNVLDRIRRLFGGRNRAVGSDLPGTWVEAFGGRSSSAPLNEATALNISAVFRAVTLLSDAIKAVPIPVYQKGESSAKTPAPQTAGHRIINIAPNGRMRPSRFKKLLTSWTLLWGNGYAEIVRKRGDGMPVELWPIHPSRVRAEQNTRDGSTIWVVTDANGQTKRIADANMLHIMGLSRDGICGMSVVAAARQSLSLAYEAERYGNAFLRNDARPGVLLKHPAQLTEDARKNLRDSWQKLHGGDNKGGLAILEEGLEVAGNTAGMSNEDAQFLETREFQVVEIARWFGVPPHKLMDLSRATFSNIEHQAIEYVGDGIMPWSIEWEEECDLKLLSADERESGYFFESNLDGLLRADIKTRYEAYSIGRQWGWVNVNEIRARENMNPIGDEGDVFLVPVNMEPAALTAEKARRLKRDDGQSEADVEFKRDVVKAFLADRTTNDVIYNLTDIEDLIRDVGLPPESDVEAPFLPVVSEAGPLVTGEVVTDSEGDVVGGKAEAPEPEDDNVPAPTQPRPAPATGGDDPAANAPKPMPLRDVLIDAHVIPLADAIGRMLRKEMKAADKKTQTMGKAEFSAWMDSWFAEHRDVVWSAIRPSMESLAMCLGVPDPAECEQVATATYSAAANHCAKSKDLLLAAWPPWDDSRAEKDARGYLEILSELLSQSERDEKCRAIATI